ncbi:MAG: hypothetical protein K0U45_07445 [Alphaproteobacteria bacterium]|nr:hypothetical protein [Alphaproteobacteria bacterium]
MIFYHIFYKIPHRLITLLSLSTVLLTALFTITACRIHLNIPSQKKQVSTAYTITDNDINSIRFDNAHILTTSLETIFGWAVGDENIPQGLRDDLRQRNSRFFAPTIMNDYLKQQSQANFDIFTFRQELLFALGKKHGINFSLVEIQLQ